MVLALRPQPDSQTNTGKIKKLVEYGTKVGNKAIFSRAIPQNSDVYLNGQDLQSDAYTLTLPNQVQFSYDLKTTDEIYFVEWQLV
jgi:glutamine cyclotransferase